ncbi:hypothetical protein [Polaribacter staleyi]|uniref:hypothetical protein n=1 Tax=Polaribacter staleyi TaxID=2022337 RepID=UPI0031BA7C5D
MTTNYQKISEEIKLKDGFYHPKYSAKRLAISEEDFIEKVDKEQLKYVGLLDEHKLINQLHSKTKDTFDIILESTLLNRQFQETNNLLFYHWFERKYNKNVINNEVLYTLNTSSIIPWYNKFSKKDISGNIYDKLEKHFESSQFPGFSIYYEYYYKFFPNIEKFTFEEFKKKQFLNYLLDLFPEIVAIDYKNKKNLWRITDSKLEFYGDDGHHMTTMDRNNTYNAVTYNNNDLPCFYPSKIGEKNYEYYKIDLPETHTPLFKIVKFKIRSIENEIREERELPKIGEGWISETLLFYKIKKSLKNYIVIHHGSPEWLGLQHFDIFIPELNIAIEYQGTQHQKPIEYFGGETAFKKGQERDERKQRLCEENNCTLFYVYPDDDIDKFVNELKENINKLKTKM